MLVWTTLLIIFVFDQWSKYMVMSNFVLGTSMPIITDIFHLTYILNRGAAFGVLENQRIFFLLIVAILFFFVFWKRNQIKRWPAFGRFALGLILGGALGNALDRYRLGAVVDFFDFRVWPIFNVADIAICVGVGLLSFYFWRLKE